ncbi:MAG: NACHT domain-containing protein [Methylococcaceae bacterium]
MDTPTIPATTYPSLLKIGEGIFSKLYKVGSSQYEKALVAFDNRFNNYLTQSYTRYSQIKTLLYRDKPVSLTAHYVPSNFSLRHEDIMGDDIINRFISHKKNIIVGTAGLGKSVFMRRLFMRFIEDNLEFIPILIELRLIAQADNQSIIDYVFKTIADIENKPLSLASDFKKEQLEYALKAGKIALLLDGFDELDYEKKTLYEREIIELSQKYNESIFIITSRPDEQRFYSWEQFYVYKILPLNQTQAIELISKIEYETIVKNKFTAELNNGLFERNEDFLSNPLLLTMMLLTYEQFAEIPEKIYLFYEQVFDTLYHKHDAYKEMYKRKSHCSLAIDDFKTIFAVFCIMTYSAKKLSFSESEILTYLKKAISVAQINKEISAEKFLNDLLQSVCVLQRDGIEYSFSHRSFQEYFTACFLANSKSINIREALNSIADRTNDSVITMLYQMNKELIEKEWFIPELKELLDKMKKIDVANEPIRYLSIFCHRIDFEKNIILATFTHNASKEFFVFSWVERIIIKESLQHIFEENKENDKVIFNILKNKNGFTIEQLQSTDYSWVSQTSIPAFCQQHQQLLKDLYQELVEKYEKKEQDLSSILFGGK